MLILLDYFANWWLECRLDRKVKAAQKRDPDLVRFERAAITRDSAEVAWSGKAVALLADDAAKYLEAHKAKNYAEFEMIPRLQSGIRPIRVTVAWANGEMPAERAARLTKEVEELQAQVAALTAENERLIIGKDYFDRLAAESAALAAERDRLMEYNRSQGQRFKEVSDQLAEYENGRWHSFETVQAIVKERELLRQDRNASRQALAEVVSWLVLDKRDPMCGLLNVTLDELSLEVSQQLIALKHSHMDEELSAQIENAAIAAAQKGEGD